MNDLIEALTIFKKYIGDERHPTNCHQDLLMIQGPEDISEDDVKRLDELSFRWFSEYECWASYRFGSY